ncbi:MAG: HD domain-containing phosphohydrolase [Chloroflexota bacterium]
MRPISSHKILISLATILSLLAQGLIFAPAKLTLFLKLLPNWGNLTYGTILFITALLLFSISLKKLDTNTNWTLLGIQALTVTGTYLLLDISTSHSREAGFLFTGAITALTTFGILANKYHQKNNEIAPTQPQPVELEEVEVPEKPISYVESNSKALNQQIASVTRKLNAEKHRTTQLIFLNELSQQLESELDSPVAAQLAVNMLEHAMECSLVSLMLYEQDKRELVALATSGKSATLIPPGYRQNSEKGLLGRAARLKKTQLVNDTSVDPDFFPVNNEKTLSEIIVPIMQNGQVKGVIEVCSEKPYAFSSVDVGIAEGTALELTRAWERSSYNHRLTELIQAGISLNILLHPEAAIEEIAILARKTFEARFVFITLLNQQGEFSRKSHAGEAPKLLNALNANPSKEPLIKAALNATKPFRVRDLRRYANAKNIEIDHGGLRSALAIPIRLHRLSIGTIIVFGKQEGVFFSEHDESLADLLASQAAAAIESSWLIQDIRTKEITTSQLNKLSQEITQTEELNIAAELIAQAAHQTTSASETGIILLSNEGKIEAEVELDENGLHTRGEHPMVNVNQAIQTGNYIVVPVEKGTLVCYPLQTRARTVGVLWMNIPESAVPNIANIQALANQAAVTLERSILLSESRRQAKEIEAAYEQLQEAYDVTLSALMSALDARDRETEGHSVRVSRLACIMGEAVGLSGMQLKALERGSLLHDIGKIGISDTILHKPGKLTDDEWKIMKTHPDIGARIIQRIPFLQECMPVVHYHHERWDGSGYPFGLKAHAIPTHARIFAVADVFDALTSKRSYRKTSSPDEAVDYLREQANILFDPEIVEALSKLPYAEFIQAEQITP